MDRTQKVTVGVCAVAIAGLVALAAPAVVAATSWGSEALTSAIRDAATDDPEPLGFEGSASATSPSAGPGAGYVFVGEGTWIPDGGPGDCVGSAWIHIVKPDGSPWIAYLGGADLIDMGPREFATGEVGYDDAGQIATYTVEPGDAPVAVGDRFCIANGSALLDLNGHADRAIQPGEVLVLDPDAVPGFAFDYPYD